MDVDRVDLAIERVRDLHLHAEPVEQQNASNWRTSTAVSGTRQPAPSQSPAVAGRRTSTRRSGAVIDVTPNVARASEALMGGQSRATRRRRRRRARRYVRVVCDEAPAFVYLLWCGTPPRRTLYCGWTTDVPRRLDAHRRGTGARYTRSRGPVELAAVFPMPDASAARREEARIKRLARSQKLALVEAQSDSVTTP